MDWVSGYLAALRHAELVLTAKGGSWLDLLPHLFSALAAVSSAMVAYVSVTRSAQDKFVQLSSQASDLSVSMYSLKQEISAICHATGGTDRVFEVPDYVFEEEGLFEDRNSLTKNYHEISQMEKRLGGINEVAFKSDKYREAVKAHRELMGISAEFRELRQHSLPKIANLNKAISNNR